jgi:hypothetical protein
MRAEEFERGRRHCGNDIDSDTAFDKPVFRIERV